MRQCMISACFWCNMYGHHQPGPLIIHLHKWSNRRISINKAHDSNIPFAVSIGGNTWHNGKFARGFLLAIPERTTYGAKISAFAKKACANADASVPLPHNIRGLESNDSVRLHIHTRALLFCRCGRVIDFCAARLRLVWLVRNRSCEHR